MNDTTYLERALVGTLLVEPRSGQDLPTLTQRDFTDPLCQAVWDVLRADTHWPPGPVNVNDIAKRLTSLGDQLHPTLRSAATVAELQTRAPARPHPHTYAQLIIDETTRRDVLNLGYQLTQIDPTAPAQAITTIDAITAQLHTPRPVTPGRRNAAGTRPDPLAPQR